MGVGPDLAMGMRIAGAHDGAAVLKNLHMFDPGNSSQLAVLLSPHINYFTDFLSGHKREREIVPLGKADDAADAAFAFDQQQPRVVTFAWRRLRTKSGKVVVENKG